MPKREPTPPPGPDEPKFLSIYYPWPPYVTLEEEKETIQCARWLSCFIGKDNLYAMFHKPWSPNVIIVEISNEISDMKMRNILGEHDWETVFTTYDVDEGITHSQVLYSTFQTRRQVEKTGWKLVEVQDEWFRGFNPTKGAKIKYPYPPTTYCEIPVLAEEVNALNLFRHLPAEIFPEARKRPATTESASAPASAPAVVPAATPPPRVVPGSGGAVGTGSNNAGGKGKKKGKGGGAAGPDPSVRPAQPLARPVEASAKAKAIHDKPVKKLSAMAYDQDDDEDEGFGNYANWNEPEPEDDDAPDDDVKRLEKATANLQVQDKQKATGSQYNPIIREKPAKDEESEICPVHKKRCKPGICEWAAEQKRLKKLLTNRTGGRIGQNQRRW